MVDTGCTYEYAKNGLQSVRTVDLYGNPDLNRTEKRKGNRSINIKNTPTYPYPSKPHPAFGKMIVVNVLHTRARPVFHDVSL